MKHLQILLALALSLGVFVLAAPALAAPTDAQKCEAAKVKEAGKYKFCRTKAISKAIKKDEAADFTKCDEKYSLKWQKWETKWGAECPTTGDEAAIQAECIACVDDLAAALEPPTKTVFLSSTTQTGNMGGVAGGDAICNTLATNAGLSGTYKAWLSDGATSPSTSFTQSTVPYVRVDGVVVANDWADLTDGALAAPIEVDENGTNLYSGATFSVWTGTEHAGNTSVDTCGGWFDGLGNGQVGCGHMFGIPVWSSCILAPCIFTTHIYCFEQ